MMSVVLALAAFACGAQEGILLEVCGQRGRFPFEVPEPGAILQCEVSTGLMAGLLNLRIRDADGEVIHFSMGGMDWRGVVFRQRVAAGRYELEIWTSGWTGAEPADDSIEGEWTVRLLHRPNLPWLMLLSGPGMVLVALGAVLWWRLRAPAPWRWFWVGAGVWTVGVALKFAWAVPLNAPILGFLERAMPRAAYLYAGSLYIGLLTGVFEIGVTLAAALLWRRMAADAARGFAIGAGAGAFEAFLLGIAAFVGILVLVLDLPGTEEAAQAAARTAAETPLAWLAGPVERVLAILCHTASRALVLLAVASGRWRHFWLGFFLMTVLDAVAGYAHISGEVGKVSIWWIELAIAPFGLLSAGILLRCRRLWPAGDAAAVAQAAA